MLAARLNVLEFLDQLNLDAYSLFGSDDSLMETTARRERDRHGAVSRR